MALHPYLPTPFVYDSSLEQDSLGQVHTDCRGPSNCASFPLDRGRSSESCFLWKMHCLVFKDIFSICFREMMQPCHVPTGSLVKQT